MADISSIRAEIKTWERDFKSKFSRDPSIQDIRDQPAVADKYKLYKKLLKAAETRPSSSQTPTNRSRIISKPLKNKGKQRDSPPASSFSTRRAPLSNPFATPSKNIPNRLFQSESPDNFSDGQPHSPIGTSLNSQLPPAPNTAVSRARKRLRGEPVSPSPNKQKRQRIGSHSVLPFQLSHPLSSDDDDGEIGGADINTSFVDDSPVKLPAGGKSFRLLFEDALPTASAPKRHANVSKSQPRSSDDAVTFYGFDSNDTTSLEVSPSNAPRRSKSHKDRQIAKADIKPTLTTKLIKKDEFPSAEGQVNQSRSGLSRTIAREKRAPSKLQEPKSSLKRALEVVSVNDGLASASSQLPLLPPSPSPEDASSNKRVPANGKGKAGASRKKAKVVDEEVGDEDEDDLDEVAVKVINRAQTTQQLSENTDEPDWDPILHSGTRNRDPDAAAGHGDTTHNEKGTFRVDLPDELRLMLAISPSRSHNSKEERVFRGLLYGNRVGHYDASRGGDIWDIGEAEDDIRGSTEGEDDWEGEPIPWEVGEL
ncbi:uncharacterized protein EDB91DRAFT_1244414 [Suillus paluster]|uniref:uncharacterized protein n=1 Tax=Suillus paluster TaxID=48578 RepID=UPI001B860044|nr:uncharacterized protein EDB91DRAFT_1244414 [Suillus paluster]KAG1749802.1 hypothetical protein EDB91DRAFT_1244414 [Suillus paluster]